MNNGNYSRTCLFQVMGENNWVIHVTQLCAVSAARELFVKFGKFDSCESSPWRRDQRSCWVLELADWDLLPVGIWGGALSDHPDE